MSNNCKFFSLLSVALYGTLSMNVFIEIAFHYNRLATGYPLSSFLNYHLVDVGLFQILKNCHSAVKEDGFLLSREKINSEYQVPEGFTVCMERTIDSERLVLFRKVRETYICSKYYLTLKS